MTPPVAATPMVADHRATHAANHQPDGAGDQGAAHGARDRALGRIAHGGGSARRSHNQACGEKERNALHVGLPTLDARIAAKWVDRCYRTNPIGRLRFGGADEGVGSPPGDRRVRSHAGGDRARLTRIPPPTLTII